MSYETDEIEAIHHDTVQEKDDGVKRVIRGIEPKYLVILAIIILFAFYLVSEKIFTRDQMFMYMGILVIVVLILASLKMNGQQYLTLEEAKAISEIFMKKEQKLKRVPEGEMWVMPDSHLQMEGDTPWKYTIGVFIQPRESNAREYEILVDPKKDGLGVVGQKWCRTGYRPQERRDIQWMRPPDWTYEKAHADYLQDGKRVIK